jgi:hypothetical protein
VVGKSEFYHTSAIVVVFGIIPKTERGCGKQDDEHQGPGISDIL